MNHEKSGFVYHTLLLEVNLLLSRVKCVVEEITGILNGSNGENYLKC